MGIIIKLMEILLGWDALSHKEFKLVAGLKKTPTKCCCWLLLLPFFMFLYSPVKAYVWLKGIQDGNDVKWKGEIRRILSY